MIFKKPQYLYKYYSFDEKKYFQDILFRDIIYFSSPRYFNDPFDKGLDIIFKGKSKHFIKKFLSRTFNKYNSIECFNTNIEEFIDDNYIGFDPNINDNELQLQKNHLNYVLSSGICCLSELNDSILMWSHYADKHSGFCIEFNFRELEKAILRYNGQNKVIIYGQKVIYTNNYPHVSAYKKQIVESVFTKASIWQYEKEWRFFYSDGAGEKIPLPEEVITAIYMGLNIEPEQEKLIKREISKKGYLIELYKANKNKNRFILDFEKISNSIISF